MVLVELFVHVLKELPDAMLSRHLSLRRHEHLYERIQRLIGLYNVGERSRLAKQVGRRGCRERNRLYARR